jgi:hypothetical protein
MYAVGHASIGPKTGPNSAGRGQYDPNSYVAPAPGSQVRVLEKKQLAGRTRTQRFLSAEENSGPAKRSKDVHGKFMPTSSAPTKHTPFNGDDAMNMDVTDDDADVLVARYGKQTVARALTGKYYDGDENALSDGADPNFGMPLPGAFRSTSGAKPVKMHTTNAERCCSICKQSGSVFDACCVQE